MSHHLSSLLAALLTQAAAAAQPAPPSVATAAPPAPSATRVLAEVPGIQGPIRVLEREGERLLLIGDEVQGTSRVGGDVLVGLLRALRPEAASALVIGLGTGSTATELAGLGLAVEAVELEPQVARLAREHFGFAGKGVVGDGREVLERDARAWDAVLFDAFTLGRLPPQLLDRGALQAVERRLAKPKGVLALRLLGTPGDAHRLADDLRSQWPSAEAFVQVFGSGVGEERQNLYVLASPAPLNLASAAPGLGLAAWPLHRDAPPTATLGPGTPTAAAASGLGARQVTLVGYLVRAREDGALVLDLPHGEMGAVRYVLRGEATAALERLLPATATFPTDGEIGSDGDPRPTLRELLGGGGVLRADTRFSTVAVAVDGLATLRGLVGSDSVHGGRPLAGDAGSYALHPLLPYGGAVYHLALERVRWTIDRAAWERFKRARLSPLLQRAARSLRAGALAAGLRALDEWSQVVVDRFGEVHPRIAAWSQVERCRRGLAGDVVRLGPSPGPLALAKACDRAYRASLPPAMDGTDPEPVRAALQRCALDQYQAAALGPAASQDPLGAEVAASRLLALGSEKLRQRIATRFPQVTEASDPPP